MRTQIFVLLTLLSPSLAWGALGGSTASPLRCVLVKSDLSGLYDAGGGTGGGTGDASAANQLLGNASLASIDTKTPASPATAGNQTSGNTKLDTLHTDITSSQVRACTKQGTWNIDSIVGNVSIGNFPSNQNVTVDGVKTTGSVMPAGGTGIIGWASAIVQQLVAGINVTIQNATLAVTKSGTWALDAGSAIIGKVGIDQTTPGTTNRVSISNDGSVTLLTGANSIGLVGLNAGSNTVGKIDQGVGGASPWLVKLDQTGTNNAVQIATSSKTTYWTGNGATAYTPPTAATDMIQITGSASKTIRVLDFVVCASATAAGAQTVYLAKRSTANSGGTSTLPTLAPLDSSAAAATAVVRQYGTVPTSLGTLVGTLRARRMMFQITAGTTVIEPCTNLLAYVSDNVIGQPFTLRGTAESLSLSNNAAALAAGYKIDSWYMVWTEE